MFAGAKATRTLACDALMDTGSPATFVQEKVLTRMLACGAASTDGIRSGPALQWGGFNGVPLETSRSVRLNVHMGQGGVVTSSDPAPSVAACLAVYAHVVPDGAMAYAVLLGRDSWRHFPERKYEDVSETETVVTLVGSAVDSPATDPKFAAWVDAVVSVVEVESDARVLVRYGGDTVTPPDAVSWVTVDLTNEDGTDADEGSYYVRFADGWSPREAIVDAGRTEIPLQRVGVENFRLHKGMRLGTGGSKLVPGTMERVPEEEAGIPSVSAVDASVPVERIKDPPETVMRGLDPSQREAFARLWDKIPQHLQAISFDFEKELWTPADIDELGDLLCKVEHRFSKHATDLGHVTIDPFQINLKKDAQPVKQRPYRHSPVLAAKVQVEIDRLLLAGILRRSYSDWSSPLVVVAKANGKIRLTCNYKRVNQQSVIPVLPLPTVADLLAGLEGAKVFSTMDLISGFFQSAIHPDSIPITAVCTMFGNYEWTRCPMGLASSPGWFQSIMLRVCEGLERCKLFIDDIVIFSKSGAEHVVDMGKFFDRMVKFDLKLAPKKTSLGVKVVKFLGHKATAHGISPDPDKVESLVRIPMPADVSQLRSLLGGLLLPGVPS